jgi:hypothetical protein
MHREQQIPLGCVSIRYLILALSSPAVMTFISSKPLPWIASRVLGCFVALVLSKGVGLIFFAGHVHNTELHLHSKAIAERERLAAIEENPKPRAERRRSINQLSNIERYTVYKGRVVG